MRKREQDGEGTGGCGVHLSPRIHQEYTFRHRSACRTNLRRAETKRKKEFNHEAWEKETSNTISLKINNERQRYTMQMYEETRNTEVQINEEEIDKLPEENSE